MSRRSTLADGIAQQLMCSICLEEFKNPKLLRCYHSYCEECVERLLQKAEGNVVKCPQCRTDMKISNGDVKSLKSNFFLNNILELMEKARSRKAKERGKSIRTKEHLFVPECKCVKAKVAKCKICNIVMCESCVDAHLENPNTKKHQFERQDASLCDQHLFEKQKFYCENCEEICCDKCTKLFHQGHKFWETTKVLRSQRKVIDWLLVKCEAKIPNLNDEIERYLVMGEMTDKHAEDTKLTIDDQFDKLITALEQKRLELKECVDEHKNEKLKQIHHEEENVAMAIQSLLSGIEFTKQATKPGNEKEFLSMRNQITSRLEELSTTEVPKATFNGRWNVYLNTPHKAKLPIQRSPLVSGFAIQSGTIRSDLTIVGGEYGVMYTTFMNQSRKFTITLKDENNTKIEIGGQGVHVSILRIPYETQAQESMDDKTLNYEDIDVTDNNDGTHSFTYEPNLPGLYYLRITINGRPLNDDHEWTVEAPLGFGDRTNKYGAIQMYPPVGTAPAWRRIAGGKYSWKIRRVHYDESTQARAGVMIDSTSNIWGWRNGRREEPLEISMTGNPSSSISWLKGEELTFFTNEETGSFIIYNETSGKSEVFERCPGTVVRPFVYPASYDVFSMDSSKLERRLLKHQQSLKQ